MTAGKTGYLRALQVTYAIAARDEDTTRKLEEIVEKAIEVAGGGRGYLVVSTPKNPFHIHTARNFGGGRVPDDEQVVSRELVKNAWDLGSSVVTVDPFGTLSGPRGAYELKSDTIELVKNLRSAIVAPLQFERTNLGALVLHEHERPTPFTIFDRLALEPLAQLAANVLAESAAKVRADVAAPLVQRPKDRKGGLIGSSPVFLDFLDRLERVAASEQNVLLLGETGTGKEQAARLIHERSRRGKKPFVAVNMSALGPELIESELFGHTRGSFTGAIGDKPGLFEAAEGGTIFLDEMGELTLTLQGRLLRVLQEKKIRSVGSTTEKPVDVRIIAATNKDLYDLATKGEFKLDVYMRLSGLTLEVPPLRERLSDIRELAPYIIEKVCREDRRPPMSITDGAVKKLLRHEWPGNVRELENVLRAAVVFTERPTIDSVNIEIREKKAVPGSGGTLTAEIERYIRTCEALRETGSTDAAIERLKTSRASLYRWLKDGKDFDPEGRLLPDFARRDDDR